MVGCVDAEQLVLPLSQRTREIGIRSAIGSSRKEIVFLILRQGLWKAGAGLAIGIIGALGACRLLSIFLFEAKPVDAPVYIRVAALLMLIAILASYLPARRASRIDPIIALRCE
jgi:putative ABC transport system permease protein